MSGLLTAVLAALAVAVALGPGASGRRVARLTLPAHDRQSPAVPVRAHDTTAPGPDGPGGARSVAAGPTAACLLAGLALLLLLGGAVGALVGLVVAVGGPRALSRLEPSAEREERQQVTADLPLALDLLAACLAGGAALPAGVRAVAEAVRGPCGARLLRVAGALEVGSAPADAWAALGGPTGSGGGRPTHLRGSASGQGARAQAARGQGGGVQSGRGRARDGPGDELAAAAARVLSRAGDGGAPVGAAVARLAADARSQARARGEQAAQRAGVLAVAPLGLCFLPAFVLLGVVPVIVGLVGPLLASL